MFRRLNRLVRHPLTLCLASFFCCFFLALLLALPLDPWARQLEQLARQQGVELGVEELQQLFPPGLGADELLISYPQIPHPPVSLSRVAIYPLWTTLIGNNPGVSFELEAFGGSIAGEAFRNGNIATNFSGLSINEQIQQLGLVIAGNQLQGEFSGVLPLQGKNRAELQFSMANLQLSGLQKFGSRDDILPIGSVSCQAESEGALVKINRLVISGTAFELSGNGSVRIGQTARRSNVTLNLTVRPKNDLDPFLVDLLSLLKKPQADGSYQLRLVGSLANARLQ